MRYADFGDTAITAENENELQILAERVNQEGKDIGMKMNIKKTKTMVASGKKTKYPKLKSIQIARRLNKSVNLCISAS